MRTNVSAAAAILLSLSSLLPAQDGCPDQVVERIEGKFTEGNSVACGVGIQLNLVGITYQSPAGRCALVIIYTPEHYTTKHRPGSHTYTKPGTPVRELVLTYRCVTNRFLWFIPIGSECLETGAREGAVLPNYLQYPCRF